LTALFVGFEKMTQAYVIIADWGVLALFFWYIYSKIDFDDLNWFLKVFVQINMLN